MTIRYNNVEELVRCLIWRLVGTVLRWCKKMDIRKETGISHLTSSTKRKQS